MPPGLSLAGAILSGTPSTTGTYIFTVKASNVTGNDYADEKQFTVVINPSGAPVITTGSNLTGKQGESFSQSFSANGNPTIVWALLSGTLPNGLGLSGNVISGTPTESGEFIFTLTATNGAGSDSRQFKLTLEASEEDIN